MLKIEEMAWNRCIAKAQDYSCRGADLYRDGGDPRSDFDAALNQYRAALHFTPDDLETLYRRGMILRVRGHSEHEFGGDPLPWYQEALADLDRVLERSKTVPALIERAAVCRLLAQEDARRGEDPRPHLNRALEDLDLVIRRTPRHFAALYTRGNVYALMGDIASASGGEPLALYEKAVADLEIALEDGSTRSDAVGDLALIQMKAARAQRSRGQDPSDRIRRSIALYEKALKHGANDPQVLNNMAIAYAFRAEVSGNKDGECLEYSRQAIEWFTRALAINPGYVSACGGRAEARLTQAHLASKEDRYSILDLAIADFNEALRLAPNHPACLAGRAEALVLRHSPGDPEDSDTTLEILRAAAADCGKALEVNPRHADALRARANCHLEIAAALERRGEDAGPHYEKAFADLDEAVLWNPEDQATYARRAVARFSRSSATPGRSLDAMMADMDVAMSDLDKLITLHELSSVAQHLKAYAQLFKAWLLMEAGKNPDALLALAARGFGEILGREISDVEVHRTFGEIHDRRGRLPEAAQAFETGLRLTPDDLDLQELLKDVRDRLRWMT